MKRTEHYEEYLTSIEKIDLGGHRCIIKTASLTKNSNNKEMLLITLDTNLDDPQPSFFTNQFISDQRKDKKWPYAATSRFVEGTPFIARFCAAVEESNPGFKCWSSDDANGILKIKELEGKKIGAVFGEVESIYREKLITKREIRYFCGYDKATSVDIPKKKELPKTEADPLKNVDWSSISEDVEGLPFN